MRYVPESQHWEDRRVKYWFLSWEGEVVWRWWEGTEDDVDNKGCGNFFQSEKECMRYFGFRYDK